MKVITIACAILYTCAIIGALVKEWREKRKDDEVFCPLSSDLFPAEGPQYDEITIYNNVGGVRTPIKKIRVPR